MKVSIMNQILFHKSYTNMLLKLNTNCCGFSDIQSNLFCTPVQLIRVVYVFVMVSPQGVNLLMHVGMFTK
jgi:hypothetical protein